MKKPGNNKITHEALYEQSKQRISDPAWGGLDLTESLFEKSIHRLFEEKSIIRRCESDPL